MKQRVFQQAVKGARRACRLNHIAGFGPFVHKSRWNEPQDPLDGFIDDPIFCLEKS
jgi:hypothetical protein